MADARSLLRASREARKIKHPHASYTSDGKLLCNLCETIIKTESAWQGHLHSTGHTLRQSRAQEAATRGENGASKKRKASSLDASEKESTKKAKPTTFAPGVEVEEDNEENLDDKDQKAPAVQQQNGHDMPKPRDDAVDEPADLEAFEKELQEMEASMKQSNAAEVTISAAPMTAEQIAAQAREEQSAQRGKRDAELEAEREDAANLLQDEFEEMEGLEERARKLREKREALRKTSTRSGTVDEQLANARNEVAQDEEAEEDDEEDEDFDDWKFGAQ